MPRHHRQVHLRHPARLYEYTAITEYPHLEVRMALAPSILDHSIAQLRTLACALAEEMGTATDSDFADNARACRELLLSVSVLLPKLQAARYMFPVFGESGGRCSGCEDS